MNRLRNRSSHSHAHANDVRSQLGDPLPLPYKLSPQAVTKLEEDEETAVDTNPIASKVDRDIPTIFSTRYANSGGRTGPQRPVSPRKSTFEQQHQQQHKPITLRRTEIDQVLKPPQRYQLPSRKALPHEKSVNEAHSSLTATYENDGIGAHENGVIGAHESGGHDGGHESGGHESGAHENGIIGALEAKVSQLKQLDHLSDSDLAKLARLESSIDEIIEYATAKRRQYESALSRRHQFEREQREQHLRQLQDIQRRQYQEDQRRYYQEEDRKFHPQEEDQRKRYSQDDQNDLREREEALLRFEEFQKREQLAKLEQEARKSAQQAEAPDTSLNYDEENSYFNQQVKSETQAGLGNHANLDFESTEGAQEGPKDGEFDIIQELERLQKMKQDIAQREKDHWHLSFSRTLRRVVPTFNRTFIFIAFALVVSSLAVSVILSGLSYEYCYYFC